GRLFVVDAGPERAVGVGQSGERRQGVGIGERRMSCGELQYGESQGGDYRATIVDEVGGDVHLQKRDVAGWPGLRELVVVAGRGAAQVSMTFFWKRFAASKINPVPIPRSTSPSLQRCMMPAPRRMMPRVMLM